MRTDCSSPRERSEVTPATVNAANVDGAVVDAPAVGSLGAGALPAGTLGRGPGGRVLEWTRLVVLGAAVLVGLLVAGCDQAGGPGSEPRVAAEGPTRLDSAAVSFSPMPTGTSLPDPAEVGPGVGIVRPGEDEDTGGGGPTSRDGPGEAGQSPYGCYLLSRSFRGPPRARSIYLHFPEPLIDQAATQTTQTTYRVGIEEGDGSPKWVRSAHCVVPATERAEELARDQVLESGETEELRREVATSGAATSGAVSSGPVPGATTSGTTCVTITETVLDFCVDTGGEGGCFPPEHLGDPNCTCHYETVQRTRCFSGGGGGGGSDDPFPEDGGGGGGSGDGGDDGADQLCPTPNPPPGADCIAQNPCERDDPPEYCAPPEREEPKKVPKVKDFDVAVDTVKIDNLPDCDDPQDVDNLGDSDLEPIAWKDYCESSMPNQTQRKRIEDALDRIQERGKVCAKLARRGQSYLEKGLILIDPEAQRAGGHGYEGLVIIWQAYVNRYYGDRTKEDDGWARDGNLDSILAHEFDHVVMDEGHIDETQRTKHTEQCSNIDY